MAKIYDVARVFPSLLIVLVGSIVMVAMDLEIVSSPLNATSAEWRIYYLDFKTNPPIWFYMGCVLAVSGLTSLWFHRRKAT